MRRGRASFLEETFFHCEKRHEAQQDSTGILLMKKCMDKNNLGLFFNFSAMQSLEM
jgi:hypothetical protein